MKLITVFVVTNAIVLSAAYYTPSPLSAAATICSILGRQYPNATFTPGTSEYTTEVQVPWAAQTWVQPACVFAPANAQQLSAAVKLLGCKGSKFAMRGGGHIPIKNAHSIDSSGVLLSSTNLNTLSLSADKNILSIGSGRRWSDAYQFLEGTGRSVVGARSTHVGVPGLLLGGGFSFHSYEHGLRSTNGNVKSYECVLGNGNIVKATASNKFSDLYWALQGGGNSLCLVTNFELQTVYSPITMLGSLTYGGTEVSGRFIDSVFNFTMNGHTDPKGVILPVVTYVPGSQSPVYSSTLFYNGNETSPAILEDSLGGILTPPNNVTTLSPLSLGQYSRLVNPAFQQGAQSFGSRQRFHLLPVVANLEAMQVVHDKYFQAARAHFGSETGVIISLAFNPVTKSLLAASNAKPGCLQGLDETPAFWMEQTLSWRNATMDAVVENFTQYFEAEIQRDLKSLNASGSFYYLNEADEGQPVFQSYPSGNLDRLKAIRRKYDPQKVFTDLMPGGFKIEAA